MNNPSPSSAPEPHDGTRPSAKLGIGKLRRKLRGRWIHPQTSFYSQAFVDGLLFVIIGCVVYEAAIAMHLATSETTVGPSFQPFFQLLAQSSWVATVFAVATGFSIGSFYDALRRWKLEEVAEPEAGDPEQAIATPGPCRIHKYVTLGRLRMPYWLYMTSTVILALALPALASVTVREIWLCYNQPQYHFYDSTPTIVGAILFCLIDVTAILARLVIVMRYLPRLEPASPGDIGEKWETADTAARTT
ncbi:hypothetical protein PG991_007928 [Apiospora marii]|uniref:Uncharacterized protein n=1 Tax=Apiospora marii TaxID=335849 RepID=A0ABR1RWW5_9PEZI